MSVHQVVLPATSDAVCFEPGMALRFGRHLRWWQRFWRWLVRRKDRGVVVRVVAVDRTSGILHVEASHEGEA